MRFASLRQTPPFDRLLLLLSRWTPECDRVLVIESGSRVAAGQFLKSIYRQERPDRVDVLTCYGNPPATFDAELGRVYLTQQATSGPARKQLFQELLEARYSTVCVLCTGNPVMTKWKWMVACRIPAKVLIVNENADSFWLDRGHLTSIRSLIRERMGLHRITPPRILSQVIVFPFTLAALLVFGLAAHTRRYLRTL